MSAMPIAARNDTLRGPLSATMASRPTPTSAIEVIVVGSGRDVPGPATTTTDAATSSSVAIARPRRTPSRLGPRARRCSLYGEWFLGGAQGARTKLRNVARGRRLRRR